jgi:hypothetical protein
MYAELDDAHLAHLLAFREIFWAGEDDVIVQIVGILPDVAGMGFANVHDVERDPVLVLFVELVEVGNLPPERRSSVASENQDDWFLAAHGRQLKSALVIWALEREIWSHIADSQVSLAGNVPQWFERQDHKRRPRDVFHRAGELIRRPQHDSEERGGDNRVKRDERACDFEKLSADGFGLEIQSRIVPPADSPRMFELTNLLPQKPNATFRCSSLNNIKLSHPCFAQRARQ